MSEKQKILIIDDNNENIKVVANFIKNKNSIIWVGTNGKMGIEIAKTRLPDLILLDIQMPDMDGFEVCKILKSEKATQKIPIIFMTARTDEESITSAYKAGGVDYITKPIKSAELIARVNTQLILSNTIKELHYQVEESRKNEITKDKFFHIIAHDLVGPIGGIASLFKIVGDEFTQFDIESIKEIIINSGERSLRIYNLLTNLLEWAKTQTGLIVYNPKMISLSKIFEESIEYFESEISKKNICIIKSLNEESMVYIDFKIVITGIPHVYL